MSVRPALSDDETRDAARRTRLANERTYLAWWRTGLTALAVCVAPRADRAGRLGRDAAGRTRSSAPATACSGSAFMVVAHVRVRMVERAVDRGDFARLDERLAFALLAVGVVLGVRDDRARRLRELARLARGILDAPQPGNAQVGDGRVVSEWSRLAAPCVAGAPARPARPAFVPE